MNTDEWVEKLEREWRKNLLVLGDFNDEPFDRSLRDYLVAVADREAVGRGVTDGKGRGKPIWGGYQRKQPFLYNPTWQLTAQARGGTYYHFGYATGWALLDQVIISQGLMEGNLLRLVPDSVRVVRNDSGLPGEGCPAAFALVAG